MLHPHQLKLIEKCKKAGHGWAKFASSVEKSGKCSFKQETTLLAMVGKIESFEQSKKRRPAYAGDDWDEHNLDAMREGFDSGDRM